MALLLEDAAKVAEYIIGSSENWRDPETNPDKIKLFLKPLVENESLNIILKHKWAAQALYAHLKNGYKMTAVSVYRTTTGESDPISQASMTAFFTNQAKWAMLINEGKTIHICLVDSYSDIELTSSTLEKRPWSLEQKGGKYIFYNITKLAQQLQ